MNTNSKFNLNVEYIGLSIFTSIFRVSAKKTHLLVIKFRLLDFVPVFLSHTKAVIRYIVCPHETVQNPAVVLL